MYLKVCLKQNFTCCKTGNKKNIAKSDNENTPSKKSTEKKEDKSKKASS